MKMKRLFIAILSVFLYFVFVNLGVLQAAEKYPIKPIECIVAMEAGADGDVLARPLMQKVSKTLGQPIMIVNKPGGGCSIGYNALNRSKPDGYTIGHGTAANVVLKLQGISPIDYHNFTQLGGFATYFPILIGSTKGQRQFTTIQEVIAYGKAHPGELSMAVATVGGIWWVSAQALLARTGLNINTIPQAGSGAAVVTQVAGGHTDLGVVALGSAKSMIHGGQVRFLATLGEARAPAPYENVPTMKELGYDVSIESTNVIMGPPSMPKDIADTLANAINKAMHEPDYIKLITERNARWEWIPPDKVVAAYDRQRDAIREVMLKAGILKESK
jgi:tripartite-type tricarboxylate transporter receptor subunit TctC